MASQHAYLEPYVHDVVKPGLDKVATYLSWSVNHLISSLLCQLVCFIHRKWNLKKVAATMLETHHRYSITPWGGIKYLWSH